VPGLLKKPGWLLIRQTTKSAIFLWKLSAQTTRAGRGLLPARPVKTTLTTTTSPRL
jgi:hypothetical protein